MIWQAAEITEDKKKMPKIKKKKTTYNKTWNTNILTLSTEENKKMEEYKVKIEENPPKENTARNSTRQEAYGMWDHEWHLQNNVQLQVMQPRAANSE